MAVMQFGKYKGLDYSEVPEDYLEYIIRSSRDNMVLCQTELMRRKSKVESSFMYKIVQLGADALLRQVPPDQHARVNMALDALNEGIAEAAK